MSDVESFILQGIERRLEVSAGTCTISIRSLARRAAREAGLTDGEAPHRRVYELADRLIRKRGGKFWGSSHSAKQQQLQSRIYIFGNNECQTCGDSNQVKTPHETFCATCGDGGAS